MAKIYNVVTLHPSLNSFSAQVMYQSKSYKGTVVSEYLSGNCMLEKISVCEIVTVLGCYTWFDWYLVTNVSGKTNDPLFRGQTVQGEFLNCLTIEDGTNRLS
jgi:hypothetical protein